jgi:NhaP-type Na+/H+ or K+/H+ antiporter
MEILSWTLLALSSIIIVSYLFDAVARKSRIPAVVLLIFSGILARVTLDYFGFKIPLLDILLPIVGTLGLILIVLEGALDLKVSRDNVGLISRAAICSLLGLVISGALIAAVIFYSFDTDWYQAWLYAIPMAVISSAVAIPAAASLSPKLREFVIYESSMSDIVGVLLFYALLDGRGNIGLRALETMGEVGISIAIGFIAAITLYWLISRIETHVRFVPMIAGVALLYAAAKLLHLAPLMIVMAAGLILNNFVYVKPLPLVRRIRSYNFSEDLDTFKHLVAEATFVIRTFFFVLLGYSTLISDLMNSQAWIIASAIAACYIIPRIGILYFCTETKRIEPLLWFAPKGLITILLIFSIPETEWIAGFPNGAIMLLVLMSALLLTHGNLRYGKQQKKQAAAMETLSTEYTAVMTIEAANTSAPTTTTQTPTQAQTSSDTKPNP